MGQTPPPLGKKLDPPLILEPWKGGVKIIREGKGKSHYYAYIGHNLTKLLRIIYNMEKVDTHGCID